MISRSVSDNESTTLHASPAPHSSRNKACVRRVRAGGHIAVERAMTAQYGDGFADYGWMRRRRNEVEYPAPPDVDVTDDELRDAIDATAAMSENARKLIGNLTFFT